MSSCISSFESKTFASYRGNSKVCGLAKCGSLLDEARSTPTLFLVEDGLKAFQNAD